MLILKAGLDPGVVTENKRIVVVSHESSFRPIANNTLQHSLSEILF